MSSRSSSNVLLEDPKGRAQPNSHSRYQFRAYLPLLFPHLTWNPRRSFTTDNIQVQHTDGGSIEIRICGVKAGRSNADVAPEAFEIPIQRRS